MDGDPFLEFCVILANLSPGNAPKWNAGVMKIYEIGLRSIPNEAASLLSEAIIDACTFRPSVAEVRELYRQLSGQAQLTPQSVIAHILELRDKYGEYGVKEPGYKNFYTLGPPAELSYEARLVVSVWGGWCAFCQDESPKGVQVGLLLKVAASVIHDAGSEAMQQLRLEFRDMQAHLGTMAQLEAPLPALESRELEAPAILLEGSRSETVSREGGIERLGRLLPTNDNQLNNQLTTQGEH